MLLFPGGLTPSIGFLKIAKSVSSLPIHVLIRSRTGDFCYDENDLKIMAEDTKQLGKLQGDPNQTHFGFTYIWSEMPILRAVAKRNFKF